jgi:beta-lactamase class A
MRPGPSGDRPPDHSGSGTVLTRRTFVGFSGLAIPGLGCAAYRGAADVRGRLEQLEKLNGGRIGVTMLDTATGGFASHRQHERFPMCSTFKFLLAGAVLQRVDHGRESLQRALAIPALPLLSHSPLTQAHAGASMSIEALCHAVLTHSDNTAANLLLGTLGGPAGITEFSRSIGDGETRLDRTELALNEALANDPRDTTTPAAMAGDMKLLLLGSVLTPASRSQLTAWMQASVTGLDRLRANLPSGWRAADKTGSNGQHTANDIAIFWPPARPAVIVTAYITQCRGPESKRAGILRQIGQLVVETIASG